MYPSAPGRLGHAGDAPGCSMDLLCDDMILLCGDIRSSTPGKMTPSRQPKKTLTNHGSRTPFSDISRLWARACHLIRARVSIYSRARVAKGQNGCTAANFCQVFSCKRLRFSGLRGLRRRTYASQIQRQRPFCVPCPRIPKPSVRVPWATAAPSGMAEIVATLPCSALAG